jgi:hypothetical protein
MKRGEVCCAETLVNFHYATRRRVPQDITHGKDKKSIFFLILYNPQPWIGHLGLVTKKNKCT